MLEKTYSLHILGALNGLCWVLVSTFACTAAVNQRLDGWNRGPGAELRLITKTSVLNDLSSLLDLLRGKTIVGWPAGKAQRRYPYLYRTQALSGLPLSFLSRRISLLSNL